MPASTQLWCCFSCQFLQQRSSWTETGAGAALEQSPGCRERNAVSIIIILPLFQCLCDFIMPHDPSLFIYGLQHHIIHPLNGLVMRYLMLGHHFSSPVRGIFLSSLGTSHHRVYTSAPSCVYCKTEVFSLMVCKSPKNLYWIILLDAGLWPELDDLLRALYFIDSASPVGSGSLVCFGKNSVLFIDACMRGGILSQ